MNVEAVFEREPIHAWILREHGIGKAEWDEMVERAADTYLREMHPVQSSEPAPKFTKLDPISQDEVGGSVERILATAYGWTTYVSKPVAESAQ